MAERPNWLQDHPLELIFKLRKENQIVGSIWYRVIEAGYEIDYLEVKSNLRQNGYGVELLKRFIGFCVKGDKDKASEIWLEVSNQNLNALSLYKKVGFQSVHIRPRYYKEGSDAVVMSLALGKKQTLEKLRSSIFLK